MEGDSNGCGNEFVVSVGEGDRAGFLRVPREGVSVVIGLLAFWREGDVGIVEVVVGGIIELDVFKEVVEELEEGGGCFGPKGVGNTIGATTCVFFGAGDVAEFVEGEVPLNVVRAWLDERGEGGLSEGEVGGLGLENRLPVREKVLCGLGGRGGGVAIGVDDRKGANAASFGCP